MRLLRVVLAPGIAVSLLAGSVVGVSAQEASPDPTATASSAPLEASLEDRCREDVPDGNDRRLCLFVVRTFLSASEDATEVEPVIYGEGDTQVRDDTKVTLVKVDWDFKPPKRLNPPKPPYPNWKHVAVLIRYKSTEDGDRYNDNWFRGSDWAAVTPDGSTYPQAAFQKDPTLPSGDALGPDGAALKAGKPVQGWRTFWVPKNAKRLEVVERPFTEDALAWTVERKKKPRR